MRFTNSIIDYDDPSVKLCDHWSVRIQSVWSPEFTNQRWTTSLQDINPLLIRSDVTVTWYQMSSNCIQWLKCFLYIGTVSPYWLTPYPIRSEWLQYVTPGLTFKHSTFCPHSAFMCFVWISKQTTIISLYSITWLLFITETECVYCAVRTGSLYIILRSVHTAHLCVLYGSQNKQRLFPYTALPDCFL